MSSAAEKLQHHARKFYRSSTPERVLKRYLRKSEAMNGKQLVRYISHVCAWIVLARPLKDAAKRTSDDGLSPVLLLGKMLGLRVRASLDDRARAALSAVLSSCKLILGSRPCVHEPDWQVLQDSIPRRLKRRRVQIENSAARPCPGRDSEENDVWMFKRMRRLNRRICKWENFAFGQRQAYVSDLVRRFAEISEREKISSVQLRGLLYEVAAALSSPRGRSVQRDALHRLDDAAVERLRASALCQKEMRQIMVQGITLWRDRLQLEDEQIELILARMQYFIERFEKRHGELHLARAGKQWARLKLAIGNAAAQSKHVQQPPQAGPTANPPKASTTKGGRYIPNERIRSFPFVKQRTDCAVKLFCVTCQRSITSDWYLKNATGKICLLVPNRGHVIGTNKVCGVYVPQDGAIETRIDNLRNLKQVSEKMVRLGVSLEF